MCIRDSDKVLPVNWHMIGHLQTNKVKYIVDKVSLIHSVDSFKLAEEIDKRAGQHGKTMDILVQVNAACDEAKFGVDISAAESLVSEILSACENIRVRGLMTIAPYAEDPEEIRPYFRSMRQLYDKIAAEIDHPRIDFKYLSMGCLLYTSGDCRRDRHQPSGGARRCFQVGKSASLLRGKARAGAAFSGERK